MPAPAECTLKQSTTPVSLAAISCDEKLGLAGQTTLQCDPERKVGCGEWNEIGSRLRTVDTPSSCSSQITPKNIQSSPCSTGDYGLSCEWWMAHYTSTLLQAQHLTLSLSLSSLSVCRSKHSLRIMMPQVLDIKGQFAHWSDFAKKHTG